MYLCHNLPSLFWAQAWLHQLEFLFMSCAIVGQENKRPWACCDTCVCTRRLRPAQCKCRDLLKGGCHPNCKYCNMLPVPGYPHVYVCEDIVIGSCGPRCSPKTMEMWSATDFSICCHFVASTRYGACGVIKTWSLLCFSERTSKYCSLNDRTHCDMGSIHVYALVIWHK